MMIHAMVALGDIDIALEVLVYAVRFGIAMFYATER